MTAFLKNRYTLIGLTTGLALSVYAAPSPAQLDVTGGEATIDNASVSCLMRARASIHRS
jgi:hypothetical protein